MSDPAEVADREMRRLCDPECLMGDRDTCDANGCALANSVECTQQWMLGDTRQDLTERE